jgi:hypothetical protein
MINPLPPLGRELQSEEGTLAAQIMLPLEDRPAFSRIVLQVAEEETPVVAVPQEVAAASSATVQKPPSAPRVLVQIASSNALAAFHTAGDAACTLVQAKGEILLDEVWKVRYDDPEAASTLPGDPQGLLLQSRMTTDGAGIYSYGLTLQGYDDDGHYENVPPEAVICRSDGRSLEIKHLLPARHGSVWALTRTKTIRAW